MAIILTKEQESHISNLRKKQRELNCNWYCECSDYYLNFFNPKGGDDFIVTDFNGKIITKEGFNFPATLSEFIKLECEIYRYIESIKNNK